MTRIFVVIKVFLIFNWNLLIKEKRPLNDLVIPYYIITYYLNIHELT